MGFFNRKEKSESLALTAEPVLVEQPIISAGELEQMVYSTYQEKLALEKQLSDATAKIKWLEEKETKLRAAETFSRQSESERKKADEKNAILERRIEGLTQEIAQERAKTASRELKIKDLQSAAKGRMDSYRRELVADMQHRARSASGGWSKARVIEFLGEWLYEAEKPPTNRENAQMGTDTREAPKDGHSGHENRECGEISDAEESR